MGKLSSSDQYIQPQLLPMSKKPTKSKKKPVKITYISSPTMFRATNASEFRAIVQELTGKDSKVLDDSCYAANAIIEEGSQVPSSGTPADLKTDGESFEHVFSSYTSSSSSSLEMDDSFFWRNVSEMSFFEFNSPPVFE